MKGTTRFATWRSSVALTMVLAAVNFAQAEDTYYLDFAPSVTGSVYSYSTGEKDAIVMGLETMYSAFPFTFALDEPTSGSYSTVSFNSDAIGTSSGIDFRDVSPFDTAAVNALDGIEFASPGYSPSSTEVVKASINLAGHEIGHLEGLRHHDSFTPVGGGVPFSAVAAGLTPVYPGPTSAFLSGEDVQSLTTATAGSFTLGKLLSDLYVGQRSAQKLTFNTSPNFFTESAIESGSHDTPETAIPLPLMTYGLPNLVPDGTPGADDDFLADMISVSGDIDLDTETGSGESDYYSFFGIEGSRVQIEVLSEIIDTARIGVDEFDTAVAIYDSDDLFLDIYYGDYTNNDELESTDSLILDLVIPETKDYIIQVFPAGFGPTEVGDYELFVSQFRVVPEPSSLALGIVGLVGLAFCRLLRRKRK